MAKVPSRVAAKLSSALKRYQPVVDDARRRDVNESDTVTIITDLFAEMFGYDKYTEITSEVAVRGTYCDLAIKLEDEIKCLIEAKAIGVELKEPQIKQATDYAANEGVDWVVLTNAASWKIFKLTFGKPIEQELITEFELTALDPRSEDDIETLYLLSRDGISKDVLEDYSEQRQALSRFSLAALITSEPILQLMRREVRHLSPGVKVNTEQIRAVLLSDVLKRDALEGDRAEDARRKVARLAARAAKTKAASSADSVSTVVPEPEPQAAAATAGTSTSGA
jgi:predicted type IV restriction endonuclease